MSRSRLAWDLNAFGAAALLLAVLVLTAWGEVRHGDEIQSVALTRQHLDSLGQKLSGHSAFNSLQELADQHVVPPELTQDGWGRSLLFDSRRRTLYSQGADGLPGGHGFDADMERTIQEK